LVACLAEHAVSIGNTKTAQDDQKVNELVLSEKSKTTQLELKLPIDEVPQSEINWHLIDRIAKGIKNFKTVQGKSYWYECGKRYSEKEANKAAHEWARTIVHACMVTSDKTFKPNPWIITGLAAHESGFDRCSIGPGPRKQAENLGFIRPSKKTISRKRYQIEKYLKSNQWKNLNSAGPDIGPLQVLSEYIPIPPENLMTLDPGLYKQIEAMKTYAQWCKHKDRPWGCWPGKYKPSYDYRIIKKALTLGAMQKEI